MSLLSSQRRWCDCQEKCLGGRSIARSTWFKHSKFRTKRHIPEYKIPEEEENDTTAGPSNTTSSEIVAGLSTMSNVNRDADAVILEEDAHDIPTEDGIDDPVIPQGEGVLLYFILWYEANYCM